MSWSLHIFFKSSGRPSKCSALNSSLILFYILLLCSWWCLSFSRWIFASFSALNCPWCKILTERNTSELTLSTFSETAGTRRVWSSCLIVPKEDARETIWSNWDCRRVGSTFLRFISKKSLSIFNGFCSIIYLASALGSALPRQNTLLWIVRWFRGFSRFTVNRGSLFLFYWEANIDYLWLTGIVTRIRFFSVADLPSFNTIGVGSSL